jgi:hypothetical protein
MQTVSSMIAQGCNSPWQDDSPGLLVSAAATVWPAACWWLAKVSTPALLPRAPRTVGNNV